MTRAKKLKCYPLDTAMKNWISEYWDEYKDARKEKMKKEGLEIIVLRVSKGFAEEFGTAPNEYDSVVKAVRHELQAHSKLRNRSTAAGPCRSKAKSAAELYIDDHPAEFEELIEREKEARDTPRADRSATKELNEIILYFWTHYKVHLAVMSSRISEDKGNKPTVEVGLFETSDIVTDFETVLDHVGGIEELTMDTWESKAYLDDGTVTPAVKTISKKGKQPAAGQRNKGKERVTVAGGSGSRMGKGKAAEADVDEGALDAGSVGKAKKGGRPTKKATSKAKSARAPVTRRRLDSDEDDEESVDGGVGGDEDEYLPAGNPSADVAPSMRPTEVLISAPAVTGNARPDVKYLQWMAEMNTSPYEFSTSATQRYKFLRSLSDHHHYRILVTGLEEARHEGFNLNDNPLGISNFAWWDRREPRLPAHTHTPAGAVDVAHFLLKYSNFTKPVNASTLQNLWRHLFSSAGLCGGSVSWCYGWHERGMQPQGTTIGISPHPFPQSHWSSQYSQSSGGGCLSVSPVQSSALDGHRRSPSAGPSQRQLPAASQASSSSNLPVIEEEVETSSFIGRSGGIQPTTAKSFGGFMPRPVGPAGQSIPFTNGKEFMYENPTTTATTQSKPADKTSRKHIDNAETTAQAKDITRGAEAQPTVRRTSRVPVPKVIFDPSHPPPTRSARKRKQAGAESDAEDLNASPAKRARHTSKPPSQAKPRSATSKPPSRKPQSSAA
ncbi:hypothetical protein BXZ70DRAFT_911666 [Cristinia sonorae]|uniref:Uncharacterized protein n=1 Tax=Cristinia sonorae TaxID=1940300 RepID=A0A8K0XJX4_9AGAR|nr:hypothetical protein BXZ70DRAFT_911666 [Cristinia sonorae]